MPQVIDVCPVSQLPPGERRLVEWEDLEIGVFNCGGTVYAIEDRCSHDDGPLIEGELDDQACTIECPRHGSRFDIRTGQVSDWANFPLGIQLLNVVRREKALRTFEVNILDGNVQVNVPTT